MSRRSLLAAALVSAVAAAGAAVFTAPAQALTVTPESNSILVTSQYASSTCQYNDRVTVANASTGALVQDLGRPTSISGVLNEAKPFDLNRKVVALWGGRSNGQLGGVGVYDRASGQWTTAFSFPSTWERDGYAPHSVTVLPDNHFAVAHVGHIANVGRGWVVVFDANGTVKHSLQLSSAHGVEWDATRDALFAVGYKTVEKYTFSRADRTLTKVVTYTLPLVTSDPPGGHDIRRRRGDDNFFVTTNQKTYVFDPDAKTFTEFLKSGGTALGGGVKGIDERFDGKVNYSYYQKSTMFFTGTGGNSSVNLQYCGVVYKAGRWLWDADQPVYPEDDTTPTTQPSTAEPFVWARDLLTSTTATPIGSVIWAGSAAHDDPSGVARTINDQQAAGKVPYVMFYHFGDDGWPKMDEVASADADQIDYWVEFATTIAQAIGDGNPAYVVIESEYDAERVEGSSHPMCSAPFQGGFNRVIDEFKKYADEAVLVNSPGLWRDDSTYNCMKPIASRLTHGFPYHTVSNDPDCTYKPHNNTYFEGGWDSAATAAGRIVGDVVAKADQYKRIFGGGNILLTDLAVTRCPDDPEWGDAGQAQVFSALGDKIDDLYASIGLRGVQIRTSGPSELNDRYMGDKNERYFTWSTQSATAIGNAKTAMQTYLGSISGSDAPTFTSTVSAPQTVAPGGTAQIQATVTNQDGSLSGGRVKLEVDDSTGALVDEEIWSSQSFTTGETKTYTHTWTAPSTTGTYTVNLGVMSGDWSQTYHWHDDAVTITVASGGAPAFTSSASASPSSVGTGSTTTITATVSNTGSSLTGGQVAVEVYAPSGGAVERKTWTAQSIAGGSSATYSLTWTAPATAGTYGVRVVVSGDGGTPVYHDNGGAGSIVVSAAKFTSSATANRSTVLPGGPVTITATVDNVGDALSNGIVDLEMYDSAGTRVGQHYVTGQNIAAGASATYTWSWTAPTAAGTYRLKIGVFGAGWTPTHHWRSDVLTVGVAGDDFVTSASATPTLVSPGGTTTMGVTVTNNGGALESGVVDLEVYNPAGTRVLQKYWSAQTILNGETKTYAHTWTVPTTTGTYAVKVGVMSSGWSTTYEWNDDADSIKVTPPTFTSTAAVSSSSVMPGGSVTIDADFTATGGSLVNGEADIEIFNPSGTRVAQHTPDITVADGATVRHSYTWNVPATAPAGTYKVKLGVFSADWSSTYHWNGSAATIAVGGGSFQPSFTVGSGANNWWVEVYTSSDVTGVDVIGKDGQFYLALEKKSWGAWAGTAPSELGSTSLVRFIARRSTDGASAGSNNFYWLAGTPTTDPGWACAFAIGATASTTKVEVVTSTSATGVEVKAANGAFTALTQTSPGVWSKTMNVAAGTKVAFRATRSDGARSYSQVYNWLQ